MSAASAASAPAAPTDEKKYLKRDALLELETRIQAGWEKSHIFEVDAPEDGKGEKYFINFPYPYMNGRLHLGHVFSLTKCEFAAGFQRLLGKRVLFPFAFHCTGMPIKTCADKLRNELETYGNPPNFPVEVATQEPAPAAAPEAVDKKSKGGAAPDKKQHAKVAAKTGGEKYQWNILKSMGVPENEIPLFARAEHWLEYFPPHAKNDLQKMGLKVDWRRSFITTPVNAYYDSFIRWQFNKLYKDERIKFGPRPCIYSPKDGQPCMDHDRSAGEGVGMTDYTLIKMEVAELPPVLQQFAGRKVFFVAATLRPETMYGQTNCWLHPDHTYGAYNVRLPNSTDIFVCSRRAATNMAHQYPELGRDNWGTFEELATFQGQDILGVKLIAPLSHYSSGVYTLPMLTIKADKGTGVVTSVPSDSPDDYAALNDLRMKEAFRQKYKITDEMVLPFTPVKIIRIPDYPDAAAGTTYSDLPAVTAVVKFNIKSQNDAVNLALAKEEVYKAGFYSGVLLVGPHQGNKIEDVKPIIRQELIASGQALSYSEPEKQVISRSGDECVVANCLQWYLEYGSEPWKEIVRECLSKMETYHDHTRKEFQTTISWLHEWACSRSFGLGSVVPWDQKWLIESLSDSTIYMAYYTIAHLLQGGVFDGTGDKGLLHIPVEKMTDAVYDYIFLGGEPPVESGIALPALLKLRHEFTYWYPFDLRCSGKDLVQNHLTFSLFNHTAIWKDQPDKWPRGMRVNGHLLIDGQKMAKSTGNFVTLADGVQKYSADVMRFTLADSGDGLEDANFVTSVANAITLRLYALIEFAREIVEADKANKLRTGPVTSYSDRIFDNAINKSIRDTYTAYETMNFRESLKFGFHELQNARDLCVLMNDPHGLHRDLAFRFLETQALLLSPVCPHVTEEIWTILGRTDSILNARFPERVAVDEGLLMAANLVTGLVADQRKAIENLVRMKSKKSKEPVVKPKQAIVTVTKDWPQWKQVVLTVLKADFTAHQSHKDGEPFSDNTVLLTTLKESFKPDKDTMPFVQHVKDQVAARGEAALNLTLPVDEFQVYSECSNYIKRQLDLEELVLRNAADVPADEAANTAAKSSPGEPFVTFV